VFSGTFTASGLRIACDAGRLTILQEGRSRKFVEHVEQICYNGAFARRERREAVFVTERAVFRVAAEGLELVEVAPGIDIERDIIAHMTFRPTVARDVRPMDPRLFLPEPMGLGRDVLDKASGTRTPRRVVPLSGPTSLA